MMLPRAMPFMTLITRYAPRVIFTTYALRVATIIERDVDDMLCHTMPRYAIHID